MMSTYPEVDFLYLNEEDMVKAGVKDMPGCIGAIEEMFRLMKKGDYRMGGANGNSHGVMMVFPEQSPFPNMPTDGPDRRFMAMPAYLGGKFDMAGMKWYGSNIENHKKGLPRSILMLTLNDKDTGAPVAYMSANIYKADRLIIHYIAHPKRAGQRRQIIFLTRLLRLLITKKLFHALFLPIYAVRQNKKGQSKKNRP